MAGRPTTYTPELGKAICDAVAASEDGLRKMLGKREDLPPYETVRGWLRNHAQFSTAFTEARRQQIEAMADDIVDVARDDSLEPNDKRIRIDTMKWLLSKLIPKTYGDRLDLTSGGEPMALSPQLIDARVQSIILAAQARRDGHMDGLDDKALKLLA